MPKPPRLILVSGPPGVGKSTLSTQLALKLGATHLDKDCIDECFSPGDRGPRYTRKVEPRVLQAVLALAELNLRPGHNVILDIPWTHIQLTTPAWTRRILSLTTRTSSELRVIECFLDERLHHKRLRHRGLDRDQVKLSPKGWRRFKKTDRLGERNPLPHVAIDMAQSRASCLKHALRALSRATR